MIRWESGILFQYCIRQVGSSVCVGVQKHHTAREVFLTELVDNNDVESLYRVAQVCLPDAFKQATGDDAFVCEYEYDTVWQVCTHPAPITPTCHTPMMNRALD